MSPSHTNLAAIASFEQLLPYLEENLDWPTKQYSFEDLTFEFAPEELGLKDADAAKIKSIHQLRPLRASQPFGIFFVEFEQKKLPVVVLRRILSHLAIKKRASANKTDKPAWHARDIIFISAFGEDGAAQRELAFAHFHQVDGDLPTLRVLGWDGADTPLKLAQVDRDLRTCLHWPADENDADGWRAKWTAAFKHRPGYVIRTANDLAQTLAFFARQIRDAAVTILAAESERGVFHTLYKGFKAALIHDLTEEAFADTYAQTITYGLLTAAISRTDTTGGSGTALVADNIADMVPVTNPFLKDMLGTFLRAGGRKGGIDFDELGIQDVVDLLRDREKTDLAAVLCDFNNKTQGEDPVIHFYEHFLSAYNKKLKIQRGVFYTPQPVVSYIVRSVHELLQTEFGLEDGLASTVTWGEMLKRNKDLKLPDLSDDPKYPKPLSESEFFVQILDPATGTATFLVAVIDVIHKHLKAKWQSGTGILPVIEGMHGRDAHATFKTFDSYWNVYVPQALLPRLHGYELLMAPYAIAHMKIGLKLVETGYRFATEERVRIYLTNALEPKVKELPHIAIEALAHEAKAVNEIKWYKRFTVVIGNPPYAVKSWNTGKWITQLVEDYKRTVRVEESQIQSLSNDYIKFLRFGEWQIEQTNTGILGLITGHGYLSGTQPRDLRNHLSCSFDHCYCIDLHGSIRRAGTPDSEDEPVFEIATGVAIFVGCRIVPHQKRAITLQESLTGSVKKKFEFLWAHGALANLLGGKKCEPVAPYYFFASSQTSKGVSDEYQNWPDLPAIFGTGNRQADKEALWATGFASQQDDLAMSFTREELEVKMCALANSHTFSELREKYRICTTNQWNYDEAKDFARRGLWKQHVGLVAYRPFDRQWTVLHKHVLTILRLNVMSQLDGNKKNIGLISSRAINDLAFAHCFVTNEPVDKIFLSSKTSTNAYVFPLYYCEEDIFGRIRRPNFSQVFLSLVASYLGVKKSTQYTLPVGLTPEDAFHYIYSVLHSPSYRARYAEFLKIDFPRLPLTSSLELFRALAKLGGELVSLHLMESPRLAHAMTQWIGAKAEEIQKVSYSDGTVWIDKAKTVGFKGVPEAVWAFHIGGYQVCEKWLKDRKGRTLSDEDIAHYHKIVVALSETIRLMSEIDVVIATHGGWPGAFATKEVAE